MNNATATAILTFLLLLLVFMTALLADTLSQLHHVQHLHH